MSNQRSLENIKKFMLNYNIQDVKMDRQQTKHVLPMSWNDLTYMPEQYFETELINMFKMSVPEKSLEKIVETVNEFDELMRDPETAKLLMEARFINRLKYGAKS
jgi:hypothetical protein